MNVTRSQFCVVTYRLQNLTCFKAGLKKHKLLQIPLFLGKLPLLSLTGFLNKLSASSFHILTEKKNVLNFIPGPMTIVSSKFFIHI